MNGSLLKLSSPGQELAEQLNINVSSLRDQLRKYCMEQYSALKEISLIHHLGRWWIYDEMYFSNVVIGGYCTDLTTGVLISWWDTDAIGRMQDLIRRQHEKDKIELMQAQIKHEIMNFHKQILHDSKHNSKDQ